MCSFQNANSALAGVFARARVEFSITASKRQGHSCFNKAVEVAGAQKSRKQENYHHHHDET